MEVSKDKLLNRKKTQEYYEISRDQVIKIFNYLDKKRLLVRIGREQFVVKANLDLLFENGVTIK